MEPDLSDKIYPNSFNARSVVKVLLRSHFNPAADAGLTGARFGPGGVGERKDPAEILARRILHKESMDI